jgi:hypothetical protein
VAVREVSGDELASMLLRTDPSSMAEDVFVVHGVPSDERPLTGVTERLRTTPCVVAGREEWADASGPVREIVDLIVDDDGLRAVIATVAAAPRSATALAVHLRNAPWPNVGAGLVAESAVYSMLQAGPEFAAWRTAVPVRGHTDEGGPAVVVERCGDELRITLARPGVRNALDTQMRDEWLSALAVAEADPELSVVISGQGPAFCAGGDLDEFGTFADPASAHEVRLARSIGAVLARLASRTTFHLHGACYGSGIELPAFAAHVTVAPGTSIALPEVGMGLIPGAGGTVSLPARIGRYRTAWLALTRLPITAETALTWGLADDLAPAPP